MSHLAFKKDHPMNDATILTLASCLWHITMPYDSIGIQSAGAPSAEELAKIEATKTRLSFFKVLQEGSEYHTSTIIATVGGR